MGYDCVIIGSGVAGLTAALYLARANKKITIIENSNIGGVTATLENIENYPGYEKISGLELIQNMVMQVSKLGVNIDFMTPDLIDFDNKCILIGKNVINYRTLIIASGTSNNRLNISNEDDYRFRGISYCAVCDGSLYKGKRVVVVTDGYSGIESIKYLENITDDLTVIDLTDKVQDDRLKIYSNSKLIALEGNSNLERVVIEDSNGMHSVINCDGLFVSLGRATDISLYKDSLNIKNGHIVTDENMHTNIDGVYAAGDIRDKSLRQIVTACNDGAIAACEAIKYLSRLK
ncbi:MAG: FAD-dependent oxidoreductase [Clostridiales bacterium]|nr:FAD-dependent oxidoreductase [Clostridiales bacterium]